jgi:hypothetical protein
VKIPTDALISEDKLTRYLLVFRAKDDKSKFLARAGFTLDGVVSLRKAIVHLITVEDAIEDGSNEYGIFYQVEGMLQGVNGVNLAVVTIWIQRYIDNCFQFITLKPKKGR